MVFLDTLLFYYAIEGKLYVLKIPPSLECTMSSREDIYTGIQGCAHGEMKFCNLSSPLRAGFFTEVHSTRERICSLAS